MVVAPGRARRPGVGGANIEAATPEELESCPFCEGREERTPPETLALPRRDPANSPGWRVRVVPNLYPAFRRQEVVVHSPRHVRSFGELTDDEVSLVADAWRERRRAETEGYLHALINEGRAAGASLLHSHSQLVWLDEEPPAVVAEQRSACGLCNVTGEPVLETERLRALAPAAARVPYELLIAPLAHEDDLWTSGTLDATLTVLANVVRRLHAVEGAVPWNAWLHAGPHWHIELFPRLTVLAGIELGAGIYVNTLPPEESAKRLRDAR